MRLVASILLCAAALTANTAEIYRWKDANGVWHYSDQPLQGGERVTVNASKPSSSNDPPPPGPESSYTQSPAPLPQVVYSCTVTAPANDTTLFGVQAVTVQLSVEPQPQAGHRIQVFINGVQRTDWPATSTTYTLPEVYRGSHTVNARVVNAAGATLCNGPPITFHLRQTSINSPQNPNNPANQPKPPTPPAPSPKPAPGGR